MVELRKAKELNDRLDVEIRALRGRVRSLDADNSFLQQTLVIVQEEVKQLESALQEQQQQLMAMQVQANQAHGLAQESCDHQGAVSTLLATRAECETLRNEICQTLKCLDKERRVDFLEMENKKLGDKILHMSHQLAALERTLHKVQSSQPTEVHFSYFIRTQFE
ncbi:unnamed protein product [Lampetra planeri]